MINTAFAGQLRSELMTQYNKFNLDTQCEIIITSGYRTPEKNKAVGGSKGSFHLKGEALDLAFIKCSLTTEELGDLAKEYFNGVIVYDRHIHVDIRKNKYYGKGKY